MSGKGAEGHKQFIKQKQEQKTRFSTKNSAASTKFICISYLMCIIKEGIFFFVPLNVSS